MGGQRNTIPLFVSDVTHLVFTLISAFLELGKECKEDGEDGEDDDADEQVLGILQLPNHVLVCPHAGHEVPGLLGGGHLSGEGGDGSTGDGQDGDQHTQELRRTRLSTDYSNILGPS